MMNMREAIHLLANDAQSLRSMAIERRNAATAGKDPEFDPTAAALEAVAEECERQSERLRKLYNAALATTQRLPTGQNITHDDKAP